ncbi:DEAD/DEAH box helicase family protein [Williamsia muralis]|uniref:DEAD/DEAH box helicase family protein n=1 Tax=Williamsia marianensis TaxID=85044 RepID=UPI00382C449F
MPPAPVDAVAAKEATYDSDDCCHDCHAHISDPHEPGCPAADPVDVLHEMRTERALAEHELAAPAPPAERERSTPIAFRPTEPVLPPSGAKARARANMDAIEVVHQLTGENRNATVDEQQVLAKWSGWGAAADVFDLRKDDWTTDRERLRGLLTQSEWGQARRNTLNAHYTDPAIAQALWKALGDAGFSSGRVLEPGCGSGTFIAYAPESAQMVGVELDSTTAQVAAALHPTAQIRNEGFETTHVPQQSFAAAIGNVPFGDFRLYDPAHNQGRHSIHNHFIIKALDLTAPGGYVAVVTSRYTMDGKDSRARREIAAAADLVGAVRLPTGAFSRVAGTEVVTDILVLRRREADRSPTAQTDAFLSVGSTPVRGFNDAADTELINQYYLTHPDNVLGQMRHGQGIHGSTTLQVVGATDATQVAAAVTERLDAIVDYAHQTGLTLTAGWHNTIGPLREQFDYGLIRPGNDTATDYPVGMLRAEESGRAIERWDGQQWSPAKTRGKGQTAEWAKLLELRDLASALIESQRAGEPADTRLALRSDLNARYDQYVRTYGAINRFTWVEPKEITKAQHDTAFERLASGWRKAEGLSTHAPLPAAVAEELNDQAWVNPRSRFKSYPHLGKLLRQDPTFAVVMALEQFNDDTATARKAALFHNDVLGPRELPRDIVSTEDAIAAVLDERAVIDLPRVAELLDVDVEQVPDLIVGHAFRSLEDPDTWIPAPQYLSGNVRKKLTAATELAMTDPRYRPNVEALTEVMPPKITSGISVRPGAPWIPHTDYEQFIRDTFGVPADTRVSVEYAAGEWSVEVSYYPGRSGSDLTWGLVPKASSHSTRFNFEDKDADRLGVAYSGVRRSKDGGHNYDWADMFADLLNNRPPQINKSKEFYEATGSRDWLHDAASRAAGPRTRRIAQEFEQWALFSDPDRAERLIDKYNELFNSTVAPTYDGSHRRFDGLGEAFNPYPYQRNAVQRIVSEPTVLLDHVVGAGKTGTMLMGAMELKRLGVVNKPWIVVPNHIVEQVTREAKQWYPAARVLSGGAATDAEGRRLFIAQSASQDWDMVIVPLSAFTRIGVDAGTKAEYIRAQLADIERAHGPDAEQQIQNEASVKAIENAKARLETRLEEALDQAGKDTGLTFEASGADYLFIDEAHLYKNLARQSHVAELACAGSDQASDLQMKLEHLRSVRRQEAIEAGIASDAYVERVATFATGTPVANNLAELWVMQTYLRPDLLIDAGVAGLDEWGATFTDTVERVELNSSGSRLRSVTRVGEFTNVGDLVAISSVFTDSVGRDQVPAQLPEKVGATNEIITFEPSQQVLDFITDLGYRADHLNPRRMDIDNALKVASDGRNASLVSLAAHLPRDPHDENRRAWQVARNILAIHAEHKDTVYLDTFGEPSERTGGLQIVFCDRSTPKADGSFSIYNEIREELVAGGMDPAGIRFIHDYPTTSDKAQLFERCRTGEVAVLLGSTEKMGTGTNIQPRAVALHHVDAPWRPADLEQREGRIIRQGNQNAQVHVFNYVAERTYDTIMWQTVYRKAHFIEQLKKADRSMRRMPDLEADSIAENAAMTKALATGDQRYLRQVELDAQVIALQTEADAHFAEQRSIERERDNLSWQVPAAEERLARLTDALPDLHRWRTADKDDFVITIGEQTYRARPDASAALVEELRKNAAVLKGQGMRIARTVGEVAGHPIEVVRPMTTDSLYLQFKEMPIPHKEIGLRELFDSDSVTGGDRSAAARAAYNSGFMRRLEGMVSGAERTLDSGRWQLDRDKARLDELQQVTLREFPRGRELREMTDELTALQRELREAEHSPEAIAAREALAQRCAERGREEGWSLMLNPTPALVEELGFDSADDVRAMMADREYQALTEARYRRDHELVPASRSEQAASLDGQSDLARAAIAAARIASRDHPTHPRRAAPSGPSSNSATTAPLREGSRAPAQHGHEYD